MAPGSTWPRSTQTHDLSCMRTYPVIVCAFSVLYAHGLFCVSMVCFVCACCVLSALALFLSVLCVWVCSLLCLGLYFALFLTAHACCVLYARAVFCMRMGCCVCAISVGCVHTLLCTSKPCLVRACCLSYAYVLSATHMPCLVCAYDPLFS